MFRRTYAIDHRCANRSRNRPAPNEKCSQCCAYQASPVRYSPLAASQCPRRERGDSQGQVTRRPLDWVLDDWVQSSYEPNCHTARPAVGCVVTGKWRPLHVSDERLHLVELGRLWRFPGFDDDDAQGATTTADDDAQASQRLCSVIPSEPLPKSVSHRSLTRRGGRTPELAPSPFCWSSGTGMRLVTVTVNPSRSSHCPSVSGSARKRVSARSPPPTRPTTKL
jgi:hypothetical protein